MNYIVRARAANLYGKARFSALCMAVSLESEFELHSRKSNSRVSALDSAVCM